MIIQTDVKGDALLARLSGELDLAVADYLRNTLDKELDDNIAIKNIIINLSEVSYIDSSGLGVLLGRYRKISRGGGKIFIVGATAGVRKILEISGLLNIMKECPDEMFALDLTV